MAYSIKQINIYDEDDDTLLISIKSSKHNFVPNIENQNKKYRINNFVYELYMCAKSEDDITFLETDISPIKLYENSRYWFEFYNVSCFDNSLLIEKFLQNVHFNRSEKKILGFYNSNNYVGTLNLEPLNINENHIEVESKKINYKDEFTKLVEELSEDVIDLISMDTSFHQSMLSKSSKINDRKENLYSSFSYIKSFLLFDKMPTYLSYLIKKPYTKTNTIQEENFIWENNDIDIDSLLSAYQDESNLFELPSSYSGCPISIIPFTIDSTSYYDTVDTFENKFIKHVLELIYNYLNSIDISSLGDKLKWEILQCKIIVSQYLETPFFCSISKLKYFSLNSKVLQRKYPYNKFLKFYFSWEMSSSIFFDMYNEMFCMGQKDVPTLYEYFCFITFIKEFDNRYTRESLLENKLLKYQRKSFNFTLLSGKVSQVVYNLDENYKLKLYYNKKYTSNKYIVDGRSYSHQLDPDISIELFNGETLIGILHFDAKYKLDENDNFKMDDLNKMHTYKDAIMGTIASYILYPGSESKVFKQEENGLASAEVMFPSVGACPLSIYTNRSEVSYIFSLIEEFILLKNNRSGKYSMSANKYKGVEKIIGERDIEIE